MKRVRWALLTACFALLAAVGVPGRVDAATGFEGGRIDAIIGVAAAAAAIICCLVFIWLRNKNHRDS